MNRSYILAPHAAWLWGPDALRFWHWCGGPRRRWPDEPDALTHGGEKIVLRSRRMDAKWNAAVNALAQAGVRALKHQGITSYQGLSDDPGSVRGNNAVHSAINGVVLAGARRIILLGVDMRPGHFHTPWPGATPEVPYEAAKLQLKALVPVLEKRGVEPVNCTPGSALQGWPIARLEEVL